MAPRSAKTSRVAHTCGLYIPGHDVHWIQGLHAGPDSKNPAQAGKLVEVLPDGTLVVDVAASLRRLWHHDPSRLERLVARNKGEVSYQPHWHLLWTRSRHGRYAFCIANAGDPERRPCPAYPPTGDIFDLLQDAGGFSMPVAEFEQRLPRRRPKAKAETT